jgi:hypothetical protein
MNPDFALSVLPYIKVWAIECLLTALIILNKKTFNVANPLFGKWVGDI